MTAAPALAAASAELQRGQAAEALGTPAAFSAALSAYERATLALQPESDDAEHQRLLAVTWMNRGNVLQKLGAYNDAVAAYDEAIARLQALSFATEPAWRNHLGAAWLNRGHALRHAAGPDDVRRALHSQRQAIAILRDLPLERDPAYRANLAGAWINLSDTLPLGDEPDRFAAARDAARHALVLTEPDEARDPVLAHLGLMGRRAHLIALGHLLATHPSAALVADTSDSVDSGLALARHWETNGLPVLPFAARLLFFGAEFYRRHQPHFLAVFLLENLDPAQGAPPAWAIHPELLAFASDALARAEADLQQPRIWVAGDGATEHLLSTRRSLAKAASRLRPAAPAAPRTAHPPEIPR